MAKTLTQGSFNADYSTIYTAPSTSYARITALYIDGYYSPSSSASFPHQSQRIAKLSVNEATLIAGKYPYSGYVSLSTSYSYTNAGLQDNSFLVPPSGVVKIYTGYYNGPLYARYSILIEEIAKTTVEA
jgi:hypothetical protein